MHHVCISLQGIKLFYIEVVYFNLFGGDLFGFSSYFLNKKTQKTKINKKTPKTNKANQKQKQKTTTKPYKTKKLKNPKRTIYKHRNQFLKIR